LIPAQRSTKSRFKIDPEVANNYLKFNNFISYPQHDALGGIGRKIIQVKVQNPDKSFMLVDYAIVGQNRQICYNL